MRALLSAALALTLGALPAAAAAPAADSDPLALARTLREGGVGQRIDAAKALAAASEASPVVPQMVAALADEYFDVRENCAEALRKAGAAAVPAIVSAMQKDDYYTRYYGARTLRRIGPAARPALAALTQALSDPAIEVRMEAAAAISAIGDAGQSADALVKALTDPNESVRLAAADALTKAGDVVVPRLAKLVGGDDPGAADAAARALGALGPAAGPAVEAMAKYLVADAARASRQYGTITNEGIRNSRLGHALRDSAAVEAIAKIGAPAVPALCELAKNPDPITSRWALGALARMGPEARAAAPVFIQIAAAEGDSQIRLSAIIALGNIGPDAEPAIPALVKLLAERDKNEAMGRYAAYSLGKIGPKSIPSLLAVLKDADPHLRRQATAALRAMGEAAAPALEALKAAQQKDPDDSVRKSAAAAIKAIEPSEAE